MFGKSLIGTFLIGTVFYCTTATVPFNDGSTLLRWINVQNVTLTDLEPAGSEKNILNPTIYVARTYHQTTGGEVKQSGIIPGKYVDKRAMFYYTHNGKWYETRNCEVLIYPRGSVSWIPVKFGESFDQVVVGGLDPTTGEILRICRLEHQMGSAGEKTISPGKLYPSGECVGVWYGDVKKSSNYEVLVVNRYGKFISGEEDIGISESSSINSSAESSTINSSAESTTITSGAIRTVSLKDSAVLSIISILAFTFTYKYQNEYDFYHAVSRYSPN